MAEAAPRAVCLLSGGMDSAVTLAEARALGFACHALSFRYGQRHVHELEAARRVAREQGVAEHRVVDLDLSAFGGSALTDDIEVPKDRAREEIGAQSIPSTYVPARNTIFLSIALGWAEVLGARDLFLGVNAVDYSGYPDCRPAFLEAFEELAARATAAGVAGERFRVHAPLLRLSKADIVRRAEELGIDLGWTHTCYDPLLGEASSVLACGRCDACLLRLEGFRLAEREDPIAYARPSPAS